MNDMSSPESSNWSEDPVTRAFGIVCEHFDDKQTIYTLEAEERHCNMFGVVHGAILFAMADIGMGSAISKALDTPKRVAAVSINANYIRPTFKGRVIAVSRVIRKGRTLATLQTEVSREGEEVSALFTGTFHISELGESKNDRSDTWRK